MALSPPAILFALISATALSPVVAADPWQSELELPLPDALPCCWRQQQAVQIAVPGMALVGSAEVVRDGAGLAVTIRDQAGAEVASLVQGGDGQLRGSGTAEPGVDRLVLLATYLQRLDPGEWLASQPGWRIEAAAGRVELFYRDASQARLDYRDPPQPGRARGFSFAARGHALNTEVSGDVLLPAPAD